MNGAVLAGSAMGTLYALLCLAVGSRLMLLGERWFDRDPPIPPIARSATAFALGHALLGTTWLCVSLVGALTPSVVLALSGSLLLVCFGALRGTLTDIWRVGREVKRAVGRSSFDRALMALLACVGMALLIRAVLPPKMDDPLQIYLLSPKVIVATGRLDFQPFNHHVVYPLLTEMNHAALLAVSNETAATIFDYFVGMNLVLALAALSRQVGLGATGSALAPFIALTGTGFTNLIGSCKVDITVAQYSAVAILFAFRAGSGRPGDAALTGLFSGAALAVKYTAAILFPGVAILLLGALGAVGRGERLRLFRAMAPAAAAGLCLVFLPQLIKNVALIGNPIAPFLSGLFGTSNTYWAMLFAAEFPGISRLAGFDLWAFPFTLTYFPRSNMLGNISPLYLGLLPALAWTGFAHARQRSLALASGAMLLTWMLIDPRAMTPRFLFPPLVGLAVVAAGVGERLLSRRIVRPAMLICLAGLSGLLLLEMRTAVYGVRYALGLQDRSSFYLDGARQEIHFSAARYLHDHVAPGARVFLDGLEYLYFVDTETLALSQTEPEMQRASQGCAAREAVIKDGGFSWLVVRNDGNACRDPAGFDPVFRYDPVVILRSGRVAPRGD